MEPRLNVPNGDRLACDATLLDMHATRVDESLLTGESVPVDKAVADDDGGLPRQHAGGPWRRGGLYHRDRCVHAAGLHRRLAGATTAPAARGTQVRGV